LPENEGLSFIENPLKNTKLNNIDDDQNTTLSF